MGCPLIFRRRGLVCLIGLLGALLAARSHAQEVLIPFGDGWRFRRGTEAPSDPPERWREAGFDDSSWLEGAMGLGYGDGDDATVLSDMEDGYLSVFARRTFEIGDPGEISTLVLGVDYDDAFICYINGDEVVRRNIGLPLEETAFDATADAGHEAGDPEFIDISAGIPSLVSGTNIIAVQGHNLSLTSSDFSLDVRLSIDDLSFECPSGLVCAKGLTDVQIAWDVNGSYDSISVLRNGEPIPGSPFPGTTSSVRDLEPGKVAAEYRVIATIGEFQCEPLICSTTPERVLVEIGDEWRFFRGSEEPSVPGDAWRDPTFDDSLWESGPTGIGFGDGDDATVLDDMEGSYVAVFCRLTFDGIDPAIVDNLLLEIDYDDGFVAWLNGVEVARSDNLGAPGEELALDDTATPGHEADGAEVFDLSAHVDLLEDTGNVLAVTVRNTSVDSTDLSLLPRLLVNGCPGLGGLSCTWDETADEVTLSWTAVTLADSYIVTRSGEPLPGSPYPPDTTEVVDPTPAGIDAEYRVAPVVGGQECGSSTCTIDCGTRTPGGLSCFLELQDGVTRAILEWEAREDATRVEISREGTLLVTLDPSTTTWTDPDVESAEPEDDTDYRLSYVLASGETCSHQCAASLCPEDLVCVQEDVGGVYRTRLGWGNLVKAWAGYDILRDGEVVASGLAPETDSWIDEEISLELGEEVTYTLVPIPPEGQTVNCERDCVAYGALDETARFDAPPGGWDYHTAFAGPVAYAPTAGDAGNLDGQWVRSIDLDEWDGSAPEEIGPAPEGPAPGGVGSEVVSGGGACQEGIDVLRILNPGDPSSPGTSLATEYPDPFDAPNNRSILLGLDTGISDRSLLDEGVTFTARWRLRPESPTWLAAGANGDGAGLQDDVGQVGFYWRDADGTGSSLAFSLQSNGSMHMGTDPVIIAASTSPTRFRSIWVTVRDVEADGTHDITVWVNGRTDPSATFSVRDALLGTGEPDFGVFPANFLAIGAVDGDQDADVQFDFVGYKTGVHSPTATECPVVENHAPTARIDAIPGRSLTLDGGAAEVTLDGSGSDDGDGGSQGLVYTWEQVTGPAVEILGGSREDTFRVRFSASGSYRFQLLVDDGSPLLGTDVATIDILVRDESGPDDDFRRGDFDGNGRVQITDAVNVFSYLFLGGAEPLCFDAADADDDGAIKITDGIRVLNTLFLGADSVEPPGILDCGPDPGADSFPSCIYDACP